MAAVSLFDEEVSDACGGEMVVVQRFDITTRKRTTPKSARLAAFSPGHRSIP